MEAGVLQQGRATFDIDLHPAHSANPLEGIKNLLAPRLLRWDNELDGILLAYQNIQRLPSQAVIRPYFPYIHLQVATDILLFRPRVGAVLSGKVTKLGADYIGMTVVGTVNAAVGRQNIRPELTYNRQLDAWVCSSDSSNIIEVGTIVAFSVSGVSVGKDGVSAIAGSLLKPWSGACKAAALNRPAAFSKPQLWQLSGQQQHAEAQQWQAMSLFKRGSGAATSPQEASMGYLQADPNTHQLNGNLGTVKSDEIMEVHSPNKRKRLDMQISEAELLPGSTTRIVDKDRKLSKEKKKKRSGEKTKQMPAAAMRNGGVKSSSDVSLNTDPGAESKKAKKKKSSQTVEKVSDLPVDLKSDHKSKKQRDSGFSGMASDRPTENDAERDSKKQRRKQGNKRVETVSHAQSATESDHKSKKKRKKESSDPIERAGSASKGMLPEADLRQTGEFVQQGGLANMDQNAVSNPQLKAAYEVDKAHRVEGLGKKPKQSQNGLATESRNEDAQTIVHIPNGAAHSSEDRQEAAVLSNSKTASCSKKKKKKKLKPEGQAS